ncbi:MAG: hypothetical protein ACPGJV_09775 [Bacteriovoracaceae bacterium]
MRAIFLIMAFVFARGALADNFKGYDPKYKKQVEKMRKFVSDKNKCFASVWAIADVSIKHYLPGYARTVYCFADLILDKGSINEKNGCMLVNYRVDNNQYHLIVQKPFDVPVVKKKCAQGGFEELVQKKGNWYPITGGKPFTVEKFLFGSVTVPRNRIDIHLINAKTNKAREYVLKKIAEGEK